MASTHSEDKTHARGTVWTHSGDQDDELNDFESFNNVPAKEFRLKL